jgi:hypothetical protein
MLGEQLADAVLADKINDLSELVSGTRPALTDPAAAGHRLGELLTGRGPALLVVDDVWAASRLAPFLQAGVRVVATTRSRGVLPGTARVLSLGSLSPEESRSLLGLGVPGLTRTDRLIQVTGRWAILLALVNGAIRRLVEEGVAAADLVAEQLRLDGPDSLDLDSAAAGRPAEGGAAGISAIIKSKHDIESIRFQFCLGFPRPPVCWCGAGVRVGDGQKACHGAGPVPRVRGPVTTAPAGWQGLSAWSASGRLRERGPGAATRPAPPARSGPAGSGGAGHVVSGALQAGHP